MAVLLGAIAFRERLGAAQLFAVALALCAVVTLTWGLGVPPWIALILASSFGLYGLVKKGLSVGPVVSVTAEVLLLSPIALTVLWYFHSGGEGHSAQLARQPAAGFSGILTGTPLIMFSYATKRITLATVGLVQYLNPTLQFLVATLIFRGVQLLARRGLRDDLDRAGDLYHREPASGQGGAQGGAQILNRVNHAERSREAVSAKPSVDDVIQNLDERRPVILCIQEENRLFHVGRADAMSAPRRTRRAIPHRRAGQRWRRNS